MNYLSMKNLIIISLCVMTLDLFSATEDGLVIVEKINLGKPVLKKFGKYLGFSYMKKEFTNVTASSDNIPSTFMGILYGYEYNWSHITIMADIGLYYGSKDTALDGEDGGDAAAEALKDSLKGQTVIDVGFNFVLNSFDNYYLRPYVGAGGYVNNYTYVDENDSAKTKQYNIKSSFVRGGFLIDLSDVDPASSQNLWRDFGVSRSSFIVEYKKYTAVDAENTSKPEIYGGFVFEY